MLKKQMVQKTSAIMVGILALGFAPTSIFAQNEILSNEKVEAIGGIEFPGEINYTQEELVENVKNDNTISDEAKDIMISKMQGTYEEDFGTVKEPRTAYNLNMTQYKQETSYYCGPASVYQTLKYMNGTSPSQSIIASALGTTTDGTDGTKIPPYLNEKQSDNYYVTSVITTESMMKSNINSDLNRGYPVIARIRLTSNMDSYDNWNYTTAGHFINIGGQNSNQSRFTIVDPYYGYSNGPGTPKYDVSSEALLEALTLHSKHHLYW